jgi:hypothetical protein
MPHGYVQRIWKVKFMHSIYLFIFTKCIPLFDYRKLELKSKKKQQCQHSRYQSPLLLPTRMRGLSSGEFHLVYSVIDSPSMCGWYKQVVLFVPHGIKYYKFVLSLIGIWEASSIKHSCTS